MPAAAPPSQLVRPVHWKKKSDTTMDRSPPVSSKRMIWNSEMLRGTLISKKKISSDSGTATAEQRLGRGVSVDERE